MPPVQVEVCVACDRLDALGISVRNAYTGGADRIELCADLASGGTTPSPEAMALARREFANRAGMLVMIRPRSGDFEYTESELLLMCEQIETAALAGADGVVFGAIKRGAVDTDALALLVERASRNGLETTFHRAFDAVQHRAEALDVISDAGVHRVLTSGSSWESGLNAALGIETLQRLTAHTRNRLEIVVGGGIGLHNADLILRSLPTRTALLSLHAYSALIRDDVTDAQLVRAFVEKVRAFE